MSKSQLIDEVADRVYEKCGNPGGPPLLWASTGYEVHDPARLCAVRSKTVIEPLGPDGLGAQFADAISETPVRGDNHDPRRRGRNLRYHGVVAVVGGMDDARAVHVCLGGPGAGRAFEDDNYWRRDPPISCGRADLPNELLRCTGPVPPPAGGPGPDDVGGIDHKHPPSFAPRVGGDNDATVGWERAKGNRRAWDLISRPGPLPRAAAGGAKPSGGPPPRRRRR